MYCPMAFANPHFLIVQDENNKIVEGVQCTPDCAWVVHDDKEYCCGMTIPQDHRYRYNVNTRPLKDDAE